MFEEYTQDYLLSVMLEKAKEKGFPVVEGNLIYNASCLMAVMLEDCFDKAEEDYVNAFPDTCDREHLIRFCRRRNVFPEGATKASAYASYTGSLPSVGIVMTDGELNYTITGIIYNDEMQKHTVSLECNTPGDIGSREGAELYLVDYVEGFEDAKITEIYVRGTDEEDTERLRERYFASFGVPGQFGNAKYWKDRATEVEGIERANPMRSTDENGKAVVLLPVTGYGVPVDAEALEKLQALCDEGADGNVVPFGQTVIASAAGTVTVNLNVSVTLSEDAVSQDVNAEINKITDEYIKEVNLNFGDKPLVIRRTALEARYLEAKGVEDCEITSINGVGGNLSLESDKIAVRGTVNVQ